MADQEVARFHAQLDAGNFANIYEAAGEQMKATAPEAEFVKLTGAVHRKLGLVKSAERTGITVFAGTDGTRATLIYKTQFQNGVATESFVFRDTDHALKLIGYNINSNALITG